MSVVAGGEYGSVVQWAGSVGSIQPTINTVTMKLENKFRTKLMNMLPHTSLLSCDQIHYLANQSRVTHT